ncbi:MAG: lytic murein transglycosylase [Gammaproteobacteria bacterium]|jgi:membrane-bound lytic murein transglycosylase B|nr:lytic murein transglycosylase [Gammaproteobacteria bacterium]
MPLTKSSQAFLQTACLILASLLSVGSIAQEQQPFADWLADLRSEALAEGVTESLLDEALGVIEEPIPRVIELDQSQPEFVQTFSNYMNNRLSQARIERGQALLEEHSELFSRISREYGVQPHYLVSFWALESNFGDYTGGFSVLNALATLAYDPRRSNFFRNELITALKILDAGHISVADMSGSWAGAMGQCQFMPSTFDRYAVDGDNDGRIDIWNSLPDIFASAANFLSESGWRPDERWGREVTLPQGFDFTESGTAIRKSVTEWNALGVMRSDGSTLGNSSIEGSIVLPAGASGPIFLAYNNFRTTMVWNRSTYYAISVGHLADRFVGGGEIQHWPETNERALSRAEVIELQTLLNSMDIDVGTPDGILGSRTRGAVRTFQEESGLPTDGYASFDLLEMMRVMAIGE